MLRLLRGLAGEGHHNLVVVRRGSMAVEKMAGEPCRLEALALRSEFDLLSAWRFGRLLRDEKVDIVHAHTSHAATLANIAARLAGGVPLVVSRRLDFSLRRNPLARLKYGWGVDRVVAVADEVRRVLLEDGLKPHKVSVVRSACDLDLFRDLPGREEARRLLGLRELVDLGPGAPLLVSVAALAGHKDLPTLLRAVARLHREDPALRAAVVGEGPERESLEDLRRELGLNGVLAMPGHSDRVPVWLAAADLFLLSSRREGIGGFLLEAQAARLPVVATRVSGLPEAVLEGETALLVPPGDPDALAGAARGLLEDPNGRTRMGEAGRRFVEEHFGVDRLVRETLAVYRSVLEERGRDAA